MGGKHAGSDEARRFAAASADHQNLSPASGQLMSHRKPHQTAPQDKDPFLGCAVAHVVRRLLLF